MKDAVLDEPLFDIESWCRFPAEDPLITNPLYAFGLGLPCRACAAPAGVSCGRASSYGVVTQELHNTRLNDATRIWDAHNDLCHGLYRQVKAATTHEERVRVLVDGLSGIGKGKR